MKKILLADDEANLRLLIRSALRNSHYHIVEAADGISAVELAKQELPDLIVLDWMMPGLSGIDVLKAMRQHAATAHTPVIMLTAKSQEKEQELGRSAGVYEYLTKPFSVAELAKKVREALAEDGST